MTVLRGIGNFGVRSVLALLCLGSSPMQAQTAAETPWTVLVIGNPSRSAPQAFADSFRVAEALNLTGIGEVRLERDLGADDMANALATLTGLPRVMLYFAGPIAQQDAGTVLMGSGGGDARAALEPLLATLAATGTTDIALVIEDCALPPGSGDGMAGRVTTAPVAPGGMRLFIAATAGPTGTCATATSRVTDRLIDAGGGADLTTRMAGLWIGSDPGAGFGPVWTTTTAAPTATAPADVVADAATDPVQTDPVQTDTVQTEPVLSDQTQAPDQTLLVTTDSDFAVIDTDAPLVSLAVDDMVVLTPADSSGTGVEVVTQARLSASDLSVVDDQTVVFIAPPPSRIAAQPSAIGLPAPSIIIGIIAGTEAAFDVVPEDQGDVSQSEISYDNLEARLALREQDPALFASLVEGGAFDPPDVELARSLQTELKRMGCYTATVDGDWGNGSRASVDRYFAELDGQTPVTRDPTIDLFRQIIVLDDVACPAPVVVQAAPRAAASNSGGTTRPAAAAAAPRAAAPAPAPAAPSGGLNSSTALGGVFR